MERLEHLELARSMCKRLNDWNVWNWLLHR